MIHRCLHARKTVQQRKCPEQEPAGNVDDAKEEGKRMTKKKGTNDTKEKKNDDAKKKGNDDTKKKETDNEEGNKVDDLVKQITLKDRRHVRALTRILRTSWPKKTALGKNGTRMLC
jgi:hypothetical protein